MLLDQQHQSDVSGITPMPTDNVDDTSVVNTSTAEVVVWSYNNAGAWAAAVGQVAGTICVSKLGYSGILNSNGSAIGCFADTSLSFAVATRAATLVTVPEEVFSKMESMTVANKIAKITPYLPAAGDYAIDHRRAQVWLNSLDVVANDAATYKYATTLSGGGTGDKVDVIKLGGNSINLGSGAVGTGTQRVILATDDPAVALLTTIDADTSNLDVALSTVATETTLGSVQTAVELIDDSVYADEAAFTLGTSKGLAVFGQYTAAGDNVADGQTGVLAMTINRHLHVQADGYDSATDSQKVYEVAPLNSQYVEQSLVDTTNITAVAHYYPGDPATTGALVAAYKDFSFTGQLIDAAGITMVVQATNDEAPGASDWITVYGYRDDTNATVNSVGGAGTTTFSWSFNEFNYKYFRVVVTPVTGGTNTVIIKMRKKAL